MTLVLLPSPLPIPADGSPLPGTRPGHPRPTFPKHKSPARCRGATCPRASQEFNLPEGASPDRHACSSSEPSHEDLGTRPAPFWQHCGSHPILTPPLAPARAVDGQLWTPCCRNAATGSSSIVIPPHQRPLPSEAKPGVPTLAMWAPATRKPGPALQAETWSLRVAAALLEDPGGKEGRVGLRRSALPGRNGVRRQPGSLPQTVTLLHASRLPGKRSLRQPGYVHRLHMLAAAFQHSLAGLRPCRQVGGEVQGTEQTCRNTGCRSCLCFNNKNPIGGRGGAHLHSQPLGG